jgi:hypothetical protein
VSTSTVHSGRINKHSSGNTRGGSSRGSAARKKDKDVLTYEE